MLFVTKPDTVRDITWISAIKCALHQVEVGTCTNDTSWTSGHVPFYRNLHIIIIIPQINKPIMAYQQSTRLHYQVTCHRLRVHVTALQWWWITYLSSICQNVHSHPPGGIAIAYSFRLPDNVTRQTDVTICHVRYQLPPRWCTMWCCQSRCIDKTIIHMAHFLMVTFQCFTVYCNSDSKDQFRSPDFWGSCH